jgi:ADP-ribosylation factor-like protein 8
MMMACRYVVDAADHEKFETTKKELHDLLSKPPLSRIPLLVVGNKNDLPEAVGQEQLTEILYENFVFVLMIFVF